MVLSISWPTLNQLRSRHSCPQSGLDSLADRRDWVSKPRGSPWNRKWSSLPTLHVFRSKGMLSDNLPCFLASRRTVSAFPFLPFTGLTGRECLKVPRFAASPGPGPGPYLLLCARQRHLTLFRGQSVVSAPTSSQPRPIPMTMSCCIVFLSLPPPRGNQT